MNRDSLSSIKSSSIGCLGTFIVAALILLVFRPFTVISPGQRGVVVKLGKVQDNILGEGIHPIVPIITQVKKMNVRIQRTDLEESVGTKDLQSLQAKISLNWHIEPNNANTIYQNVGSNSQLIDVIIVPALSEAVKASTPQRNSEEILKQRETLKQEIDNRVKNRLEKRGIKVVEISLVRLSFSDNYKQSIERKKIAEQDAETAKKEAEAMITKARGQAEAQELLRQSLNSELLQKQAIEKWDGKFPMVIGGNGTLPMINIDPSKTSQFNP
ncbi:MAG: prohibitin family protein [Crocosphaera sp.]|nr:prohibitin family protein [Crocosphaera sp.]